MGSRKGKKRTVARGRSDANATAVKVSGGGPDTGVGATENLARLRPIPADHESPEDLAVFTRKFLDTLSSDLAAQAQAVNKALDLVAGGSYDAVPSLIDDIPRSSPYADWRLLIRGLVAFYQNDLETARKNWSRLDTSRRPSRIASTLLRAVEVPEEPSGVIPYYANAAQQLLFRPHAIKAAEQIVAQERNDRDTLFCLQQTVSLKKFINEYRSTASEFVTAFARACVIRSTFQERSEIFESIRGAVQGPATDPYWNLLALNYYRKFIDADELVDKEAKKYIDHVLPNSKNLGQPLISCLGSWIETQCAVSLMDEAGPSMSYFEPSTDYARIERLLRSAINRYPRNRLAHDTLRRSLERQFEEEQLNSKEQKELNEKILSSAVNMVEAFPDDVDTKIWLVEKYFVNEDLERASSLIKSLSVYRVSSPIARAFPWKLKLLEAMRFSRRKSDLEKAKRALADSVSIWPTWLNQRWSSYLHSALELRSGTLTNQSNVSVNVTDMGQSAVCDFMMFAAAQRMNVPRTTLKPMRMVIDQWLDKLLSIPLDQLLLIGDFFWDLNRAGLTFPAYRSCASKIGKVMVKRIGESNRSISPAEFCGAVSWAAHHGYWMNRYSSTPDWLLRQMRKDPKLLLAECRRLLENERANWFRVPFDKYAEELKAAAQTERDSYYEYQYQQVSRRCETKASELASYGRFGNMRGRAFDSDDDDSYDEDEVDFCMCENCRAQRMRESENRNHSKQQAVPQIPANPTKEDLWSLMQELLEVNGAGATFMLLTAFLELDSSPESRQMLVQFCELENLDFDPINQLLEQKDVVQEFLSSIGKEISETEGEDPLDIFVENPFYEEDEFFRIDEGSSNYAVPNSIPATQQLSGEERSRDLKARRKKLEAKRKKK